MSRGYILWCCCICSGKSFRSSSVLLYKVNKTNNESIIGLQLQCKEPYFSYLLDFGFEFWVSTFRTLKSSTSDYQRVPLCDAGSTHFQTWSIWCVLIPLEPSASQSELTLVTWMHIELWEVFSHAVCKCFILGLLGLMKKILTVWFLFLFNY